MKRRKLIKLFLVLPLSVVTGAGLLFNFFKKNKEEARELKNELQSVYDEAMDLQKEIEEMKKQIQRNEELGLNEEKKNWKQRMFRL